MTRILLLDHNELTRSALKALIRGERDLEVVAESANAERAVLLARAKHPDLIVFDAEIPGMGALEATRRFLRLAPAPTVLVLGTGAQGPMPGSLLEAGARGYVTKGVSRGELFDAIRSVARGERYLCAGTAKAMALGALEARPAITRLTPRELAVMQMVSQGHPRAEISNRLCVSPKTVSTYRSRLMRKLGARSDVELTHLSLSHGLIPFPQQVTAH